MTTKAERIYNAKLAIKDATSGKGRDMTGVTFEGIAAEISAIETGVDTSDANAIAADILATKSGYVNGVKITGTMPDNGTVSTDISAKATEVTIAAGKHSGSGIVKIADSEQAKIVATNIKKDVTILGVTGIVEERLNYWVPPSDWVNISSPATNTIESVVSDEIPYIGFIVTTNGSAQYTVVWGDGVTENFASGATAKHSYTVGAGQSCFLGYTTFKCIISSAANILTFKSVSNPDYSGNGKTGSLLYSNVNCPSITSLANAWQNNYSLIACKINTTSTLTNLYYAWHSCYNLMSCSLPTTLSAWSDGSYAWYNCYKLNYCTLPTTANSLQNLQRAWWNCISLQECTLPTSATILNDLSFAWNNCLGLIKCTLTPTLDYLSTLYQAWYNCTNLIECVMPTSMTRLTSLYQAWTNCYRLKSCTLPASLDYLQLFDGAWQNNESLETCILPASMNALVSVPNLFYKCYSLKGSITIASNSTNQIVTGGMMYNAENVTEFILNLRASDISFDGTSVGKNKVNSVRLLNQNSLLPNSLMFRYTSLSVAAIETLFGDIPNGLSSGKSIYLTGTTGAAPLISKTSSGTTLGSTTVTLSNTSSLAVGMEVYGTGLSSNRAVTMQDNGDTVTLNAHGFTNGTKLSFTSITTTTGISINYTYFVINVTANTFQVSLTAGGSALALTTNGSGNIVVIPTIVTINTNVSIVLDLPASATGTVTVSVGILKRSIIMLKGFTVTS